MNTITKRYSIEPTLMIVLLLCKQVCDTIIQDIIEGGEIDGLIAPFKENLQASLMNNEMHYISEALVIANRSELLIDAINKIMAHMQHLMIDMASTIIPVTDRKIEGETDEGKGHV